MNSKWLKSFSLNFGPQHPAAHGVLRLILHLKGESVLYADPHIGLLHRGTEKLIESKSYLQALPYFDRLDYVSTMAQEHTYSLAVETILDMSVSKKVSFLRIFFLELTRILNHLMAVTTHALDLGALTPFLWAFEVREKLMELYEQVCGARLHAAYIQPGGVFKAPSFNTILDFIIFLKHSLSALDDIEALLNEDFIWISRLKRIGFITKKLAKDFSFSGVLLRSVGVPFDLRIDCSYELYNFVEFKTFVTRCGDCYDRYILRMFEMRESSDIMSKLKHYLLLNDTNTWQGRKNSLPSKKRIKFSMEELITHFKLFSFSTEYKTPPKTYCYTSTEAPKGEFGLTLLFSDEISPYRCKIRAPGFFHLQGLNKMSKRLKIADVVAVIGTQDIVFGEVDR